MVKHYLHDTDQTFIPNLSLGGIAPSKHRLVCAYDLVSLCAHRAKSDDKPELVTCIVCVCALLSWIWKLPEIALIRSLTFRSSSAPWVKVMVVPSRSDTYPQKIVTTWYRPSNTISWSSGALDNTINYIHIPFEQHLPRMMPCLVWGQSEEEKPPFLGPTSLHPQTYQMYNFSKVF